MMKYYLAIKNTVFSPVWCSSVDWAPAYKPKGCQFDSQSGHMPGLQPRSPVWGVWEATTHWCFFPSLSPSLLLSLKRNKIFLKKKNTVFKGHLMTWHSNHNIMCYVLILLHLSLQKCFLLCSASPGSRPQQTALSWLPCLPAELGWATEDTNRRYKVRRRDRSGCVFPTLLVSASRTIAPAGHPSCKPTASSGLWHHHFTPLPFQPRW